MFRCHQIIPKQIKAILSKLKTSVIKSSIFSSTYQEAKS
ncbi:MAG: hypothetical protein EBS06_09020 [Proteobacteria bacterium]|nr:hypothetical protein [Pseudomonadota bacterium]